MIKNIKKLKQFGIFQDYKNNEANKPKDFGKYNLFFGYNMSGKSTLARLFHCIENRAISSKHPQAKFVINYGEGENNPVITQNNITQTDLNIRIFDRDFVQENLWLPDAIKGIVIGKGSISDTKKLEELKIIQKSGIDARESSNQEIARIENEIDRFMTTSAKNIKEKLRVVGTSDNYYIYYDKSDFKNFIDENAEKIKSKNEPLDQQSINELTNAAKPDEKPKIDLLQQKYQKVNSDTFTQIKNDIDDLLKTSVMNTTMKELSENSNIQSWVEEGLRIHKESEANQCKFCNNTITEERFKKLEDHFNDNYKRIQKELKQFDQLLDMHSQDIESLKLPASRQFYDELQNDYGKARETLKTKQEILQKKIEEWRRILQKKIQNPFQTDLVIMPITEQIIEDFKKTVNNIDNIVEKHNHKTNNFKEETKKAKKRLELNYATEQASSFNYFQKEQEVKDKKEKQEKITKEIDNRDKEIKNIENSLSNERLGRDQFNKSLHKFIGHKELSLRFSREKEGYEIFRNDEISENDILSEGEKTAMAFIYFITKLKENGNNIEDTIIVIDDPVSSFDSNHLLSAYSYMKNNCENAKQLFVLTHNFTFFKYVRDWIVRKNTRDQKISNLYVIEAHNINPPRVLGTNKSYTNTQATVSNKNLRHAEYKDAPSAIEEYNSEYYYIFSKLHLFREDPKTFETDNYYLVANLSRKLLETFLAFKFPKNRGNFRNLLDDGVSDCEGFATERGDKIHKFVNRYSHCDSIETNEDSFENLMGEGIDIISDIFEMIEKLDKKHYSEMIGIASDKDNDAKRITHPQIKQSLNEVITLPVDGQAIQYSNLPNTFKL